MVCWHDRANFCRLVNRLSSPRFCRHADRRLLESLTTGAEYYDFSGRRIDEEYEKNRDDVIVKARPYPLPESGRRSVD